MDNAIQDGFKAARKRASDGVVTALAQGGLQVKQRQYSRSHLPAMALPGSSVDVYQLPYGMPYFSI